MASGVGTCLPALLDYGEKTLPVTCAMHVVMFIAIFHNAGTASNYISYLHFAHKFYAWPYKQWDTEEVRLALKGLKKLNLADYGGPSNVKFLLTEDYVQMTIRFYMRLGAHQLAMCCAHNPRASA